MLPATELTQIREDLENTLPDYCHVLTLTRTSDSQGGWAETWGTSGSYIACRMDFIGGAEAVTGGALIPYSRAILTLPRTTTITTQDRIEHNDIVYTVQAVNIGSWLGVKRATLTRV